LNQRFPLEIQIQNLQMTEKWCQKCICGTTQQMDFWVGRITQVDELLPSKLIDLVT
jgi:hypothetical protein